MELGVIVTVVIPIVSFALGLVLGRGDLKKYAYESVNAGFKVGCEQTAATYQQVLQMAAQQQPPTEEQEETQEPKAKFGFDLTLSNRTEGETTNED